MQRKVASGRLEVERGWEGSRLEGEWLAQVYEQIEPVVQPARQQSIQQRGTKPAWCFFKEGSDGSGEDSGSALRASVVGEASEREHDCQPVGGVA